MVGFLISVFACVCNWRLYQKMGREGWEGIVPLYNTYVLFQELYGNGWKFLLLLIPLYNIYLFIKMEIDLAHAFNKGTGFGIGLVFLNTIFLAILAFGDPVYRDGKREKIGKDVLSQGLDNISDKITGEASSDSTAEKLKELEELHNTKLLTDEEYEKKRAETLEKL